MKKGLLLALTMVALVAMVLPAGAIAPVIESLPSVVIGDASDNTGTDAAAKHLYRYTNIMNIAASNKVTWGNVDLGFGDAQKHAYYMSTDANLKAYNDSTAIAQVTAGDIAAIQTAGTKPAAAKEITGPNFFWLSLANNLSGTANAYTATPAANGLTAAQFTPSATPATFTLVLADGDFPTTAMAQSDFSVYTVPGAEDGFSGAAVKVYGADFATGSDGWVWDTRTIPGLKMASHAQAGGKLTANLGSDTSAPNFGTWTTGFTGGAGSVVPVNQATLGTDIFRGTFTLSSTAANAANTPGYRLFYQSEAFTHIGGIAADSISGGSTAYYSPSSAGTKDVFLYWAVPFTMSEYGDTGKLATVQTGKDFRAYFLAFDTVCYDSTDSGVLGLDNVIIDRIARPSAGSSLANWGSGGLAFNADMKTAGWAAPQNDAGTNLGFGTGTVTANTIVLKATNATTGYQKTGPFSDATALPKWNSDQLIRTNLQIASSSVNAAPAFRVMTLCSRTNGLLLPFIWVDVYDASVAKTLYAPTNTAAAMPVTGAGSALEIYAFTHTAGTGADAGVLDPQVDCYTTGAKTFTQTGAAWPVENANLTISKWQYELVTP